MSEHTEYMTASDVMRELGISRRTFYKYIENPDIPLQGEKVNNRLRRFTQEEVAEVATFLAGYDRHASRKDDATYLTKIIDGKRVQIDMRYKNRKERYANGETFEELMK